jgi:N-acetyl-D-muramate 6-phosphate phosphatase
MPLDLTRIQAFCFDIDGTLSDTDDQAVERLVKYFFPLKLSLPIQDQYKIARRIVMAIENPGNFLIQIPDRFGFDSWIVNLHDSIVRNLHLPSPKSHTIIDGTTQVLSQLAQTYPLVVVSARGARMTNDFIDYFQLGEYFQMLVHAQTCRHTKPFPDPILYVAQKLNISSSACVMVGDTTIDIRAGLAAGAQTIGVLSGFGEENELKRAGADVILKSVAEIPLLLSEHFT